MIQTLSQRTDHKGKDQECYHVECTYFFLCWMAHHGKPWITLIRHQGILTVVVAVKPSSSWFMLGSLKWHQWPCFLIVMARYNSLSLKTCRLVIKIQWLPFEEYSLILSDSFLCGKQSWYGEAQLGEVVLWANSQWDLRWIPLRVEHRENRWLQAWPTPWLQPYRNILWLTSNHSY